MAEREPSHKGAERVSTAAQISSWPPPGESTAWPRWRWRSPPRLQRGRRPSTWPRWSG